jgi:hypothetical protein
VYVKPLHTETQHKTRCSQRGSCAGTAWCISHQHHPAMEGQEGSSSQAPVQEIGSSGVEMLALRGCSSYTSMQFNRSSSFTARASPDCSMDSEQWQPMQAQGDDGATSSATTAPAWGQPGFEPFEVEEQDATEVKYLKGALLKKVRPAWSACMLFHKQPPAVPAHVAPFQPVAHAGQGPGPLSARP